MRKQTKITSFCSHDENSQLFNKSTNGSLQFKHPFASTLQWNIQLVQFLKNVSQERKASNEQIIWKKSCSFIFPFVQEIFYFIPEDKNSLRCTTAWKPPDSV